MVSKGDLYHVLSFVTHNDDNFTRYFLKAKKKKKKKERNKKELSFDLFFDTFVCARYRDGKNDFHFSRRRKIRYILLRVSDFKKKHNALAIRRKISKEMGERECWRTKSPRKRK